MTLPPFHLSSSPSALSSPYHRPQVFLKPMPPYCTWEHTDLTLACQQGGTDGVWVAPRAHAAQLLDVLSSHQRGACTNAMPAYQCRRTNVIGDLTTAISNCPHHGRRLASGHHVASPPLSGRRLASPRRRLASPLRPSCCGPQEYLLAQALHHPNTLRRHASSELK